jgi:hypothetical protein
LLIGNEIGETEINLILVVQSGDYAKVCQHQSRAGNKYDHQKIFCWVNMWDQSLSWMNKKKILNIKWNLAKSTNKYSEIVFLRD